MSTGTSAEIRAAVAAGNKLVEEAQFALRQATERFNEARVTYASIQSKHLDSVVAAVDTTVNSVDEALRTSNGITDQANAYASQV